MQMELARRLSEQQPHRSLKVAADRKLQCVSNGLFALAPQQPLQHQAGQLHPQPQPPQPGRPQLQLVPQQSELQQRTAKAPKRLSFAMNVIHDLAARRQAPGAANSAATRPAPVKKAAPAGHAHQASHSTTMVSSLHAVT